MSPVDLSAALEERVVLLLHPGAYNGRFGGLPFAFLEADFQGGRDVRKEFLNFFLPCSLWQTINFDLEEGGSCGFLACDCVGAGGCLHYYKRMGKPVFIVICSFSKFRFSKTFIFFMASNLINITI